MEEILHGEVVEKLNTRLEVIEELTGARCVAYWAPVDGIQHPASMITNFDVEVFRTLLEPYRQEKSKLFLILTSPGGRIEAAESLMHYITSRYEEIEIAIPFMARSAATLLCFISREVFMGDYSFLGPISPIVGEGDSRKDAVRVLEEFETMKEMMFDPNVGVPSVGGKERAGDEDKDVKMLRTLFQGMYSPLISMGYPIFDARRAISWVKLIATKTLRDYHLKGEDEASIEKLVSALLENREVVFHAKNFSKAELREMGLKIVDLDREPNLELGRRVLEVHDCLRHLNRGGNYAKIVFTGKGNVFVPTGNRDRELTPSNGVGVDPGELIASTASSSVAQAFFNLHQENYTQGAGGVGDKNPLSELQLDKMLEVWDNVEDEFWDEI
ncbi:MAG: hypothetical protein ACTSU5_15690 [Promethearchaeota archaeon]